ncbi:MAG: hypothetical protein ACKO3K_06735, partial [Cuspidothrix sp.]
PPFYQPWVAECFSFMLLCMNQNWIFHLFYLLRDFPFYFTPTCVYTVGVYGEEDDQRLQKVLKKYGNKITLGAVYEKSSIHQGHSLQLNQPHEMFRSASVSIGTTDFAPDVDGKIHHLGSEYVKFEPDVKLIDTRIPSFAEAVLKSAQIKYPPPKGDRIYFWGNEDTGLFHSRFKQRI